MATPAKVPAKTWGLAGAKTAAATASPAKAGTAPAKGAAAAPVEEKKDAAPVVEKPPFQAVSHSFASLPFYESSNNDVDGNMISLK
jgi:hypothetical protein